MKDFNRLIKVKEKLPNYSSLCVFLNWARQPATMVAKTAFIVAGGGQYHTNKLIKSIRLMLQLGVSLNRP